MKLSYDEFKEKISEDIFKYLPEMFYGMGAEVDFIKSYKTNRINENIVLRGGEKNISPSIGVDAVYRGYLAGNEDEPDAALRRLADRIVQAYKDVPAKENIIDSLSNVEELKRKIFPMFVNYEENEEMVSQMPYRRYLDLAVTYYVSVSSIAEEQAIIRITDNYAKHLGMDEQSLYEAANNNLEREGYVYKSMQDTLKEIGVEEIDGFDRIDSSEPQMNVISNKTAMYGASVILMDGLLDKIYEKAGEKDFYILPSSVHELIIMTNADKLDVEMLSEMVMSVNESQVALEERLSNQVYRYNGEKKSLSIASENPNSLHFVSDLRKQMTI